MKSFFITMAGLCLITGISSSCRKTDSNPKYSDQDSILLYVDDAMHNIYLWKDSVTEVDWHEYSDPAEMMYDMKYKGLDKWSGVYPKNYYESVMNGESESFGFKPAWDGDKMIIESVYKNSSAYRQGLRRGYRIESLNGQSPQFITDWRFFSSAHLGDELTIVAVSLTDTLRLTISKDNVTADQIMHHEVLNWGQKKVGYIVYESFTERSRDSLLSVMDGFREAGVTELVIDLRYNGGGDVSVLVDWASKILPARYNGRPFLLTKHNKDMSKLDSVECVYPDATSLGVERVFIITTSSTASASEALINGLKPYIEVHQIGSYTRGKPVGMYVFEFKDWYVLPISFETTNAYGQGGYYLGIKPEKYMYESTPFEWGDLKDEYLAQARQYILHGSYSDIAIASNIKSARVPIVPMCEIGLFMKKPSKLTK